MRLSQQDRQHITQAATNHFGEQVDIRLFGSRVDDTARGGDIDLYIESDHTIPLHTRSKFLHTLECTLGEQKIDLVIHNRNEPCLAIHKTAQQQGVRL